MLEQVLEDLRQSLKNHPNIIGKERSYKNAAVLIPLVEVDGAVHLLFQVRAAHIRQGGEVGFPGGMMEAVDGGDYEKTALRETVEELGISEETVETIGYLGTYVAHSDVTIDVYVGVLKGLDLVDLPLSEEVAEVFTVPLDWLLATVPEVHYFNMKVEQRFIDDEGNLTKMADAKALGLPERYNNPYYMRQRKVYFYRYEGKAIWGMTGDILYEFLALLK